MAESVEAAESSTTKAPKDKSCPYCGQAFTSSSLGRHLDLYIREKNPKPPDGIHDVDAIRKIRENITRRQPRGSLARRATSTPAGTPTAMSKKSPASDEDSPDVQSPVQPKETQPQQPYPFTPGWEATGVINDIPAKSVDPPASRTREGGGGGGGGSGGSGGGAGGGGVGAGGGSGDGPPDSARRQPPPRLVSRQLTKAQFEWKQKVQDAVDTAKAAELALREMISSWRAAKQFIEMDSMPFDFDPLSMDFPALTLHCLQPPPTLFSLTQHSTPTSWSIPPPGPRQYDALETYFREEFRKWRITCASATTAVQEELAYPPSSASTTQQDVKEAVIKAEQTADALQSQVQEHLKSAYSVWDSLSPQRRSELWVLELARSVGRKQKEVEKLKETQRGLKQENANLRSQIEHLNRLQQPREFKIMSPTTYPLKDNMVLFMLEQAVVNGRSSVGLNMDDRHLDLNTIVQTSIDRWKKVIASTRAANSLSAQRPLDQATPTPVTASTPLPSAPIITTDTTSSLVQSPLLMGQPQQQQPPHQDYQYLMQRRQQQQQQQQPQQTPLQSRQQSVPTLQQPPPPRQRQLADSVASASAATTPAEAQSPAAAADAPTPTALSMDDDDMSDQDADAEMEDDDGYPQMHTPIMKPPPPSMPQQQTVQLQLPRNRGPAQMVPLAAGGKSLGDDGGSFGGMNMNRSVTHGNPGRGGGGGGGGSGQSGMTPSMPNISSAMYGHDHQVPTHPDMGISLQQIKGDPMYMD